MRFGTVNGTYQYGGASTNLITLGRTGISHQSESGNGILSSTSAESLGMISVMDSAGMFITQSYNPSTPCEQDNFVPGGNNSTELRYPETQTAEGRLFTTGTNGYSKYQSATAISGNTLALSGSMEGKQSSLIGDLIGSAKQGFDANSSTLNYNYQAHDHLVGYSDPETGQDDAINFLWSDFSVNATLGEEVTNNTTSEEVP